MAKIILAVYGVLMLGGGFMGYAKAGSKMSLMIGIVSAMVHLPGIVFFKVINKKLNFSIYFH